MLSAHVSRLLIMTMSITLVTNQIINSIDMLPAQNARCSSFTKGISFENNEFLFSSPGYPIVYPNLTECIKVIQAPYPNQVIRLDFRGTFFIETSSQCDSDYLEIRDGPYGFSPPLAKNLRFCGKEPPKGPPLESTGAFMWLRFKSDEVIEHEGVQAVYSFVSSRNAKKEECRIEKILPIGRQEVLETKNVKANLPSAHKLDRTRSVDCTFDIITPVDSRVFMSFDSFTVRKDDICDQHRLEVYDSFTLASKQPRKDILFCKNLEPRKDRILISSRRAVIRVLSKDTYLIPQFVIAVTVIRLGTCQENVEFDCGSGNCIDSRLVCNNYINCPSGVDEEKCPNYSTIGASSDKSDDKDKDKEHASAESAGLGMHAIILSCIGGALAFLTLCCLIITVKQRAKEKRQQQASLQVVDESGKPLSRTSSVHRQDTEALMSQWFDGGTPMIYEKQNGSATIRTAPTPPPPPVLRRSPSNSNLPMNITLTPILPSSTTPKSANIVRVSKFLGPSTSNNRADSPIEMFGYDSSPRYMIGHQQQSSAFAPVSANNVSQQETRILTRSLPRGEVTKQASVDTPASFIRDCEFPPPLLSHQDRRVEGPPLIQSRSIPGHLGTAGDCYCSGPVLHRQDCINSNNKHQEKAKTPPAPPRARTTRLTFQA